MYADLATIFDGIVPPERPYGTGAYFSAVPVPSFERYRIAKDAREAPAILISVEASPTSTRPASIILEHLTVEHDVDCRIIRPDISAEEGRFTVVRCIGGDRILHSYFLRVAAAVLQSLGPSPSRLSVSQAVNRLAELFHTMTEPPRKSLQGLWAEVFLIARGHDPIALTRAWHATPQDLYDFNSGNHSIEVKSARGRVRRHYFTLDQLQPLAGMRVIVASIFVEASEAGASLVDLLEQIESRLAGKPELMLRIENIVGLTLGENWRHAIGERFDLDLAEKSLAFYDTELIPKVNPDVPSGVSDIRFRSDLTGLQSSEATSLRAAKGIFRAALRL